ncbi:MAG: heavy metal-binding domain-containing protein [Desulfotomaculales bacterium]
MKVTDPACKMTIEDKDAAATSVYGGTTYYFCSKHCKARFDRDPGAFVGEKVPAALETGVIYACPMHPEVREKGPGACPICGMALESVAPAVITAKTEWTCPMHPEIVRDSPGPCPICGMALEPRTIPEEEENPELIDMTRRFRWGVILTIPLVVMAMRNCIPGLSGLSFYGLLKWVELILATPVVLWAGWPFFVRGWQSVLSRNLNMFTLIALGVGLAYGYSVVGALLPDLFPASFRKQTLYVNRTGR